MFFDKALIQRHPSSKWKDLYKSRVFTVNPLPIELRQNVFCMGSCFARNIRRCLEEQGVNCLPDYGKLSESVYDMNVQVDNIGLGEYHMNYYTPLAIVQEVARSLSFMGHKSELLADREAYCVPSHYRQGDNFFPVWQDPARRLVFAQDKGVLYRASDLIGAAICSGIRSASLFVFTLGLVEQFSLKTESSTIYFNQHPTYASLMCERSIHKTVGIEFLGFENVRDALLLLVDLVRSVSQSPIVFTVSPVPLEKTFRKEIDCFSANLLSKSILLAATREACLQSKDVYYFPSYEIATGYGSSFFQDRDLRHPKDERVAEITELFISCCMSQ